MPDMNQIRSMLEAELKSWDQVSVGVGIVKDGVIMGILGIVIVAGQIICFHGLCSKTRCISMTCNSHACDFTIFVKVSDICTSCLIIAKV